MHIRRLKRSDDKDALGAMLDDERQFNQALIKIHRAPHTTIRFVVN